MRAKTTTEVLKVLSQLKTEAKVVRRYSAQTRILPKAHALEEAVEMIVEIILNQHQCTLNSDNQLQLEEEVWDNVVMSTRLLLVMNPSTLRLSQYLSKCKNRSSEISGKIATYLVNCISAWKGSGSKAVQDENRRNSLEILYTPLDECDNINTAAFGSIKIPKECVIAAKTTLQEHRL